MEFRIRHIKEPEIEILYEFLYLAIYQPDSRNLLPRSIVSAPEVALYVEDWGKPDDICLVAENEGELVGAVWTRIFAGDLQGFGSVDSETPELSMSVLPEFRAQGIGSKLMKEMLDTLAARVYSQVSLSVQKENPALRLYKRIGFVEVVDHGDEVVMIYKLAA